MVIREEWREATSSAAAPATYTILFLCLMFVWHVFSWPTPEQVFNQLLQLYRAYGSVAVFAGAFIEGIVLINLYFPGSAVILIGVVACRGNPMAAALVILVTILAFILSAQINFLIGYHGFHRLLVRLGARRLLEQAHTRYTRYGKYAVPLFYFHPNLGAFIAVSCGVGRLGWSRFLLFSSLAIVAWNGLWGSIVYSFSTAVQQVATSPSLLLLLFLIWTIGAFVVGLARTRRTAHRR